MDLLPRTADIEPDVNAVRELTRTSTLSGGLQTPVLTMYTTNDVLVPVQFEEEYGEDM